MGTYEAFTYGDRVADIYDEWYGPGAKGMAGETDAAVEFLAARAGGGRALELGIGTGRIALPLAAKGVEVFGIDASEQMVRRLREKPGGSAIDVRVGDFAEVAELAGPGEFSLVYVVFNTFFGLLSQDAQVRCFEGVAERLAPDGRFVIEVFVPDLSRFQRDRGLVVSRVELDAVHFDASAHDPVRQRVRAQHVVVEEAGTRLYPVEVRYAWPAELDLMARLAGLRLAERRGGWAGEPFTATSGGHVSVYSR